MGSRRTEPSGRLLGARRMFLVLVLLLVPLGLAAFFWGGQPRAFFLARNTLALAAATAAISLPVGMLLGILVARTNLPGRRPALVVLAVMLFLPLYIQAAGWDAGFGRLGWFSMASGTFSDPLLSGWHAVIWIHSMVAVPWVALLAGLAARQVQPELEETALLEQSPLAVLRTVTVRRMLAAIGAGAAWVTVSTATEITATDLYQVRTYAEEIYTGFAMGESPEMLAASAAPSFLITIWLVLVGLVVAGHLAPPADAASMRAPMTIDLGRWRWPAACLVASVLVLLAAVPIVNLAYNIGLEVRQVGDERIRRWSTAKFYEFMIPRMTGGEPSMLWRFREELGWTVRISVTAASLAVVLAAPLAWLARRPGWREIPALVTAAIALAVPAPLVGIAITRLATWGLDIAEQAPGESVYRFAFWCYDRTVLLPSCAILVRALPVALFILWYSLRTVPQEILDSAHAEGAGSWTRFWHFAARLRLSAFALAWLAALAVAMGELAASAVTVPPGMITVAIRVFDQMHAGVFDQVAGISLTSALGFAAIAVAAVVLVRKA